MLWSGAIVDIPVGWALCDGTLGTPDLTDRFIVQAGDTYNPDDSGGDIAHLHTFTSNDHFHSIPGGTAITGISPRNALTGNKVITGTTNAKYAPPPYYALAYVMKL